MTLGRRPSGPPRGIQQPPAAAQNSVAPDGAYDGYIRGISDLPPVIPDIEDRPVIRPTGKTHWEDIPVLRKGRRPSSVLTCLLKRYHPGIVDYKGKKVVARDWDHYHVVKNTNGHSLAEKMEEFFWLRYKYEDEYAHMAKQHVRRCCKALLPSIFYYARIQAIIDHFRKVENNNMNDKLAGQYYLDSADYLAQRQAWLSTESWAVLVAEWTSVEWIAQSRKRRANRASAKFKPHKGGSNSMTTISQKLSKQTGEEINQVQAWVHTHKGPDENNPAILNTPQATSCLERYTKRVKQLNGDNFDWMKNPVSSKALYDCSLGKPHGRWALFNGIVNDTDVVAEVRAGGGASSAALKRCRAEQNEDELRRETEKARKAESYANSVLSWGLGMYEHCNGMHKLVETLATERGMPMNEIPPPPVPPPARSPSPPHGAPHQSIVNISPHGFPHQSIGNILETSQEPAALCAQQSDHSYLHEHVVTTDLGAQGMFGGFFSEVELMQ